MSVTEPCMYADRKCLMWKAEITWSGTEGESVSLTWKVLVEDGSQTRLTRTRTVALNGALGSTFSIPSFPT